MNLTPVEPEELRSLLNEGVVSFAFKKVGGDLRTAVGTTALSSIPVADHPSGNGTSSPKVVPFFDKEKQEWRSVSIEQEIFIAG
jgi:hypothetical protein